MTKQNLNERIATVLLKVLQNQLDNVCRLYLYLRHLLEDNVYKRILLII